MNNSVKKNYIYNLAYQILIIIVPLITTPYVSRTLGAESIGIYSYTYSIVTYFILLGSLGITMYGQREIAYVQEEKYKRSKVFWEIIFMRFITLGISLILFYIAFTYNNQYSMYYKILIFDIIANAFDSSWLFHGLEDFKKTVIRNTIVKLISICCIFIFIKETTDLWKYFIIYVFSNLIGNISLWMYVPKYIEKVPLNKLQIFKHLKPTIALFIPQVAVQIYTVLDTTMIGIIVANKSEVGYYEQAQKIVKLLLTLATSLGTVMLPRMANTFAKGDKKKLEEYTKTSFQFVLLLSFPLMFGMLSVVSEFVPVFYGSGYDKVTILINIILPIILIIGLSNVIGTQYLLPTKRQKEFTISVTAGAIVNFMLNIFLIKLWGATGASIATVIAEITVTGLQFYIVRKEIKLMDVIKISKNYFIASMIMFAVSYIVGHLIENDVISMAIQIVLGIITYFSILFLMKDKMVCGELKKLKK